MGHKIQWTLVVVVVVLLTATGIFFTPLRYTKLIEPKIHDVLSEEIYTRLTRNPDKYLFMDVRPKDKYDERHAEGSINTPIAELYDGWRELPRTGKEIVLICGKGNLSGVAYFFLQHFGFTNIVRVAGGVDDWATKGLPVVSNSKTIPI